MFSKLVTAKFKTISVLSSVLGLVACGNDSSMDAETALHDLPEVVDYNFHIKPILSDTCFLCHGPDLPNAKAGLSLNTFERATTHVLESGNHAIVPGKPKKSEALQRITSTDPNIIMPPPNSNLVLSDRDKAMIKKWIKQGAEYKKHWAFITPQKPALPNVKNKDWPVNPLDHFVLKQIEDKNLTPSEQASKETLIRRVSFDLTGLPPTIEEIDQYLADDSDNAYEKVVDRLLASDSYGERVATEWLDVARYADTHGYATDPFRDVSPYRDWVIEKFNQNMPFDTFITWQLAGDLLPNATNEQKLATAFNRMHTQNNEGGLVLEEFRVEYVKDRVQSVGTGLLGLTLHCAQCHDHKYDDVPTKDYYQTFAMFNNNDDSGQISWDANDMPVPTMLLPTREQKSALEEINSKIEQAQAEVKSAAQNSDDAFKIWQIQRAAVDLLARDALVAHYPLDSKDSTKEILNKVRKDKHGRVLFSSNKNQKTGADLVYQEDQGHQAILLNGDDALYFPDENHFNRATPLTVAIKAKLAESTKEAAIFHHNKSSTLYAYKGFDLSIVDGHWLVRFAHTYPYNAIAMRSEQPIKTGQWQHLAITYDGSSKASGVSLYINGESIPLIIERDNLYKDISHPAEDSLGLVAGLKVGARWRDRGAADSLVSDLKVWSRDLSKVEIQTNAKQAFGETYSQSQINDPAALQDFYNKRYNQNYLEKVAQLTKLRNEYNSLNEPINEMMIMQELEGERRQSYILDRGLYSNHGEKVEPGVPEAVYPFDDSLPKNRIGLAKWLTDPQHPLVSRVISNRYWAMLMGDGIVRTPEDFGSQGKLPTHPDALDWLSREFVDSGWDVKHLIKTIAMSATYQQSSVADKTLKTIDPENTLFARGPRVRLTAEMLRDNVLAASGLLVNKIGGKSVYPYQPEGLWKMNRAEYKQSKGDDLYRRSMYTVWKRNAPPPSMHNFDTPTRTYTVGARQATDTPLQALTMMNDSQFVEAGRVLAEKVITNTADNNERLIQVYRLLTSQYPDENELSVMSEMYTTFLDKYTQAPEEAEHLLAIGEKSPQPSLGKTIVAALSAVANLIINHDATVIKR
ncbi:DUF1553 domain-containing protein [Paraglaciecola aquimarina]|uniref:DUF1553 domain-containing protein n=1 Tax=Paraglaciecola algarum TaxID=3050085 RepID=A0ABS9D2L1_9ALTE|nr:DUF1553 domain-containing protein [Paraglaciecola sp. G1-23]MCF2947159.1 DUF1553 domain-containing protein [Paraglaciecola sp. G1-23]